MLQIKWVDNFTTKNINSLTEPLSIQSLASAPLEIMAGKIIIDTEGNTKFLGNVEIARNLKINSLIYITPIPFYQEVRNYFKGTSADPTQPMYYS